MISRSHIYSFLVVAALYLAVAVWKLNMPEEQNGRKHVKQMQEKAAEEAAFWKYYNRGNELRRESQYEEAASEYGKALKIKQQHKDALYYAGSMNLMVRNYDRALDLWSRLKEQEPNAPRTLLQLGTLYFCMDADNLYFNLSKAEEWISEAWNLNREETGAPLLLAKIYMLQGELSEAGDVLEDLLSVNDSNEQILFLAGYYKWRIGEEEQSQKFLRDARLNYVKDKSKGFRGEGATKAGNAILDENLHCDGIKQIINDFLVNRDEQSFREIYEAFMNETAS